MRAELLGSAIPLSILAAVIAASIPFGVYRWGLWLIKPWRAGP